MTLICKEREELTSSCIQNCGCIMPRAFINLESTKCLSNFVINMLGTIKHWAFTCAMDAKKTSLHVGGLIPTIH
jgi:hypothetical protein